MNPTVLIMVGALLLFFIIIAVVIYAVLKRVDPKNADVSENYSRKDAQSFMPFTDIRDDMIEMPGKKYRMVLDCSSLNYNLKTPAERDQIEASFQQVLNSINYNISIFIQTKTIDNRDRNAKLRRDIDAILPVYPGVKSYAESYYEEMLDLHSRVGNSHQKKRYIMVTYDDASTLDNLSSDEQVVYAKKELLTRCNALISGLSSLGIQSSIMNTAELIEMVYSCYYRDDYSYSEAIASGEPFAIAVHGPNLFENMTDTDLLDLTFTQTINRIYGAHLEDTEEGREMLQYMISKKEEHGNA